MKINIKNFIIEIESTLIICIVISIFSLKTRTFLMSYYTCYLFIIFHELSHILIASLFGYRVNKFKFTISGVNITLDKDIITSESSYIKKILIYMAGPVANFIFAILFKDISMIFEINIFLGILNFLPIYPLDGYNISYSILRSYKVINIIQNIVLLAFIFIGIIQVFFYKSISILVFSFYIFMLRIFNEKIVEKSVKKMFQ